jgi:hypothetical protein
MLGLVALAALIAWGVYLQRRGEFLRQLAFRESGVRMKLSILAFKAEQKVFGIRRYEQTLARGKVVSLFASDDPREREANQAFLAEAEAWWSQRVDAFRALAAEHQDREVRFLYAASRPWESLPPQRQEREADQLRRIAVEQAELEFMCRDQVDRCKGQALRFADMSRTPPDAGEPDRRQEFAGQADAFVRQSKEAIIQADSHAAMRRKYRRAAAHPKEPLPPDPPDPNLLSISDGPA